MERFKSTSCKIIHVVIAFLPVPNIMESKEHENERALKMIQSKTQPTYKRQRFLLDYIRQIDGGASATDIQKLIFLQCQLEQNPYYEFIPYKYGPYSFQLAEDLETLLRDHFIDFNSPKYSAIGKYQIVSFFYPVTERGDRLIRKVYEAYPYYAINSVILGRLFNQQEEKKFLSERLRFKNSMQMLFTIGYEGRTLEAFVNTLIKNDIRLLCDVRRNPLSRKFGFSKSKLQHVLETVGIQYVHIPEVGIDSEKRTSLNTLQDYDALFGEYKANLHNIKEYLDYIGRLLDDNVRIALMCFEEDPQICHRHIIRDYLIKENGAICEDL